LPIGARVEFGEFAIGDDDDDGDDDDHYYDGANVKKLKRATKFLTILAQHSSNRANNQRPPTLQIGVVVFPLHLLSLPPGQTNLAPGNAENFDAVWRHFLLLICSLFVL